jgi:hypothetical protein
MLESLRKERMRSAVRRPRQSIHDPAPSEANTDAGAGEKANLSYVSSRDIGPRRIAAGKTLIREAVLADLIEFFFIQASGSVQVEELV